jgi:hypothetical protein
LLNWATLFGAIGNRPGELLQYTPTWHHGHAIMRFLPARSKASAKDSVETQTYGGYKFKNRGFEFYRHPPPSAYKLNKLLFEVRNDAELRRRMLTDLDAVAAEWGLSAEEKEGARAIASVGSAVKISDNAAALVKAGAHPLQALMSLHAVHGEFRRMMREAEDEK